MSDTVQVEQKRSSRLLSPTIGLAGFGFLFGWHFLILYFSFPMAGGVFPADFIFIRQVILNASLCLFFALFGRVLAHFPHRDVAKDGRVVLCATGIGVCGSVLLVAGSVFGVIWSIFAVMLIGASEAILMLMWLSFFTETSENYSGASLGAATILASLICFFTYHLTFEVSVVVLVALPLVSGSLFVKVIQGIPLRKNDPLGSGIPDWDSAMKPYWKTTAQLMAMALFFGLLQGCSSSAKTLLPAADPVTILGAGVAGMVLFVMYSRTKQQPNLVPVVSLSLIMYVAGMMLLPFNLPLFPQVAAFLIMTGFIFCFILTLILIIDLCRTFDLNAAIAIGMNQALEYLMFAVGVMAGSILWEPFSAHASLPFAISFAGIFTLFAITVFLTTERPPWEAAFYKPQHASKKKPDPEVEEEAEEVAGAVDVLALLGSRYAFTPREVEVFTLLSRGRNAEFIQKTLFISNHTVKTHIYNIYRKMDIHSLQDLLDILDAEEALYREGQPEGAKRSSQRGN